MTVGAPVGETMVARAKRILLEPKLEWDRIDVEPASIGGIFRGWVLPLAAIPAVAMLIGSLAFGYGAFGITYRPTIMSAVATAIIGYVLSVVGVFVLSLIIDWLAPNFGGTRNRVQATKVAAYSMTASWLAGIFNLIPALSILALLGLYSLYLLYLGLPRLMKTPEDKGMSYTAVTIVAAIVLYFVIGLLTVPLAAMFGGGASYAPAAGEISGTVNVPGMGEVDLGKLEQASKQMEQAAKQMEKGAATAAVAPTALQALLPAAIGSYRRVELSSSGASAGGMGGSVAEARYENGAQKVELRVSDIAAVGALAAMGSAFNAQSSTQTETGYEKVGNVDGRMTTEKWDNGSKEGSYSVLVANRFMVEASGNASSIDELRAAVNAVGVDRLESLIS